MRMAPQLPSKLLIKKIGWRTYATKGKEYRALLKSEKVKDLFMSPMTVEMSIEDILSEFPNEDQHCVGIVKALLIMSPCFVQKYILPAIKVRKALKQSNGHGFYQTHGREPRRESYLKWYSWSFHFHCWSKRTTKKRTDPHYLVPERPTKFAFEQANPNDKRLSLRQRCAAYLSVLDLLEETSDITHYWKIY